MDTTKNPAKTADQRIAKSGDYLSALERELANGADIKALLAAQEARHAASGLRW